MMSSDGCAPLAVSERASACLNSIRRAPCRAQEQERVALAWGPSFLCIPREMSGSRNNNRQRVWRVLGREGKEGSIGARRGGRKRGEMIEGGGKENGERKGEGRAAGGGSKGQC